MTTLKDAQNKGQLDKFVKEREGSVGDKKRLHKTISSMALKKKKATPAASDRDSSES